MAPVADTMTARQAAERLQVTPETVRAWARSGRLRALRYPSGRMRFRSADIEALLRPSGEPTEAA